MSLSKLALNTMIAGAIAIALAGVSSQAHAESSAKEKCFGVAKAGQNDCAAMDKSHSCAAHSTLNGAGGDFVTVPKGLCAKLNGGSTTPTDAPGTADGK